MEPTDKNSKSTTNVCKYIEITALRNVSDNGIAKISIWKYLKFHVNAVVLNNVDLFLLAPVENEALVTIIDTKKTPKLSTVKESEVVATPVQTKNVLIKPNSTELKRAPLKKKRKINEVKNSALYNAEGQILLFSSDMEIHISNWCFCPIVTVT